MRLIDADELIERAHRERLDSRELIAQMIESAPTVVDEENVALKKELDYWYKLAKSYMVACGASYIYQDCADNRIETWVDEMPTVEPIKHGHWIVDEDGNIKCSECGHCGVGDNYCERCGAKMEDDDETN